MSLAAALALAQAVVPRAATAMPPVDPCLKFDEEAQSAKGPRAITARDLAELGDIGRSDPNESASPFGVSPDGRQIAFLVRRGNPDANGYCQRLLVTDTDGKSTAREIDRGGEFIRATFSLRNFPAIRSGYAQVITPRWSPDGTKIAFLKRMNGETQVWLVDGEGQAPARRVSVGPDDVEDFSWAPDGASLVIATRPDLRRQTEAIAREARGGFLFDERFAPQFADRPIPTGALAIEYDYVDLARGTTRAATAAEIAMLVPERPQGLPKAARGFTRGPGGVLAWTEAKAPSRLIGPSRLVLSDRAGRTAVCEQRQCEGAMHLWWSRDGRRLYVLQKTGWGAGRTALLRWQLGAAAPRRIFVTDDALIGCAMPGSEIVCAREGAAQPRRLVAIDPDTGRQRIVFDPNPRFAALALGRVQRLRFRNAFGVESYADLVLPPGHRSGEKYPLVVVQYTSDGFLRGGTDDEVPIQALAAKGFAVLSFARPDFVASVFAAKTELELRTRNRADWIDRRSVQSSLEVAIGMAVASGAIDPARMGISGFSDGTSTVQWALINSALFKAASLGACCEDIYSYPLSGGPAFEQFGRDMGYRFFEPGTEAYWKPMSLVLNADRVDVPILIQTGDSEYEIGLDVVEAFRRRGKAIELYVLDDEPHFKWQPAHRLAIYERSLEWFQFWLMHTMNCDPAKDAQYVRWKAMKGAPLPADLSCEPGPPTVP